MAKRQGKIAATEHKIEDFAEDLGKMLGHARNKAEGWLSQRDAIVKNLTQLRDEATKLLAQLGHEAGTAAERGVRILRGRPPAARALVVNKLARSAGSQAPEDVEGRAGEDFSGAEGALGEGEGHCEEIGPTESPASSSKLVEAFDASRHLISVVASR